MLHQASFLSQSLYGRSDNRWTTSVGWIVRASRSAQTRDSPEPDTGVPESSCADEAQPLLSDLLHCPRAWLLKPDHCLLCRQHRPSRSPITTSATAILVPRPHLAESQRLWPVTSRGVTGATTLGALFGHSRTAFWLCSAPGWWPRPARAPASAANARWEVSHCHSCDRFRCLLVSTAVIPAGTPVQVDASLLDPVTGCPRDRGLEVTYDGATSDVGGTKVSGAAAILWAPVDDSGHRAILARRFVALPGSSSSELAEARGAATAIHLALDSARSGMHASHGGTILIAGDSPAISRYCALQGRRDSADVHAILGGPLSLATSSGRGFEWILLPRAFNSDSHDAATIAAAHAASLAGHGSTISSQWTE